MATLTLRGARAHNLREVDLDLPLGSWVAVTGPSGSGKTTLVFDTLVREGQRRTFGAWSARARQALGKLGRADVDALTGLPATISIGRGEGSAHARSTVGTLTGTLPLLRLLFARQAVDPGGVELSRSHFSFNHPLGACEACGGLGVEDRVDPSLIVADPRKSLRQGALVPTLKSGYTVYSQVTVEVMDQICRAHGFDVDTPWQQLTDAQRDVILYGTRALKVPFGKHSLQSRMRWEGITARPREEGYYRGLVPVITETLARNRNDNVLRFVRSAPCSTCGGTRLSRPGREARIGEVTLPSLLEPPPTLLRQLDGLPRSAVLEALLPGLTARLGRMVDLGLGHLALRRPSTTLSGGEAQRVRLVAQLQAGLSGLLVAFDEPTLGLHAGAQPGLRRILEDLRALGNTVITVEHDPDMVRHADRVVQMGPGAGPDGGRVLSDGPTPDDPLGPPPIPRTPRAPRSELTLRGATLHNLADVDLTVGLGALNVVTGPSGAGKSSLVFGTLLPALEGKPGSYRAIDGADGLVVRAVDASPIGRTPRSTPATWSGLFDRVRARFAATPAARERGWTASRFSYNAAGRCPTCDGLGARRIGLHLLEDVEQPCDACGGSRYAPEVLEITDCGRTIADVLALTVGEAVRVFADDPPSLALVTAMDDLGLGYLPLGRSSTTLSRGEAQRVKLATLVGGPRRGPSVLLLDEPDRGLHPDDLARLIHTLDRLVDAGDTVVAISHHRHLQAAADRRIAVEDGSVIPAPPLSLERLSRASPRPPAPPPDAIRLGGVRTHTLADLDVTIPHRALTGIVGVSGSGKTSLAFDTVAAEANRRLADALPFEVRRHLRRLPRPHLEVATGLTPTLALRQDRPTLGQRATVATQTGLGPLLRLLWSRAGTLDEAPCPWTAEHFSPDRPLGACPGCDGTGVVLRCDPERLVTHPELSLVEGALQGTKPGRFFGEPDGQHLAALAAATGADLTTPWRDLPDEVRRVALQGAPGVRTVRWRYARGGRSGEHVFEGTWDGLCALVEREARKRAGRKGAAEWAAPLSERPCPDCGGGRLRPEVAAVRVRGLTLPDALALRVDALSRWLEEPGDGRAQGRAAIDALRPELIARLDDLGGLGLGHLTLDRRADTLSGGELQRVRLASVLRAGSTGLTLVLDEPAAGLHDSEVQALTARLRSLVDGGHTVIVVAHRPELIRACDHLLELGPGAGAAGGRVVAEGPARDVLAGDGPTARALAASPPARRLVKRGGRLAIRGACAHNLRDVDVDLPDAGFVAVAGPSGSGKSTLVFDVIGASAAAGRPVGCRAAAGLDRFREVRTAAGPGTTPLSALGVLPRIQALYAASGDLPKRAFSFHSPAGRCEACGGTGIERVSMDVLADLQLPCPRCDGRRYRPEVLAVRWEGYSVADLLEAPVDAWLDRAPEGPLRRSLEAMARVGLGHLSLGRRRGELSGGEAARLTLAASLVSAPSPSLFLLDEPASGLHEADLARLIGVIRELAEQGHLVVATEHRRSLIAAADEVVALGPGGGPDGGRIMA